MYKIIKINIVLTLYVLFFLSLTGCGRVFKGEQYKRQEQQRAQAQQVPQPLPQQLVPNQKTNPAVGSTVQNPPISPILNSTDVNVPFQCTLPNFKPPVITKIAQDTNEKIYMFKYRRPHGVSFSALFDTERKWVDMKNTPPLLCIPIHNESPSEDEILIFIDGKSNTSSFINVYQVDSVYLEYLRKHNYCVCEIVNSEGDSDSDINIITCKPTAEDKNKNCAK